MQRPIVVLLVVVLAIAFVRPRRTSGGLAFVSRIGRALRRVRSGDARMVSNDPALRDLPRFDLSSTGFVDGAQMSAPFVGPNGTQAPLTWSGEPAGTIELALIVEDIDVPLAVPLTHAIAYGIDPKRRTLPARSIPPPGHMSEADPAILVGRGSGGQAFLPPTPIPGHGAHRYVFQAFALSENLRFTRPPNRRQLVHALRRAAVARATLTGTHENP